MHFRASKVANLEVLIFWLTNLNPMFIGYLIQSLGLIC
jgi:hypothetical protein